MIRIQTVSRFTVFIGFAVPALASAQGVKPADPAAPPRGATTVKELVTTPSGEEIIADRTVAVDPTSGVESIEVEGDEPDPKVSAVRRTLTRTYQVATPPTSAHLFDDPLKTKFGLILAPVDDVLRSQLEIAKGQGVVVVQITPGSLAEQAGLKPKDVLLSLGDKPATGVGPARSALLGLGKDAIEVKLIREGKPRRMSVVGPEHGFPPESSEFWIGVPVSPVDAVLRSHLPELPADAGLIANDVVKESPADKAGVKKHDILVSMGGKPLKSADTLIAQVQASAGKPVPLVVLRGGKPTTTEVTPAKRAHPTVISLTPGQQQLHYEFFQPNVAVEVHKRILEGVTPWPPGVAAGKPGEKGGEIEIELFTDRLKNLRDLGDSRIAAQLKELTGKVEELRKAIEGLKKPEGK